MTLSLVCCLALAVVFAILFVCSLADVKDADRERVASDARGQYWFEKFNALRKEVDADAALDRTAERWRDGLAKASPEKLHRIMDDIFAAPSPVRHSPIDLTIAAPFASSREEQDELVVKTLLSLTIPRGTT